MSEVSNTPSVRYRTIVCDPPWPYPEGFAVAGPGHDIRGRRRTHAEREPIAKKDLPYSAMSLDEIQALPLADLSATDARLFLWATNRYLPYALQLLPSWDFTYKQLLVWDKRPHFNPLGGSVTPNAGEFLVVANRGTPKRIGRGPSSIISARKPRLWKEHSRKPDAFLDLVEQVSPGPYLELFARRQRLGWDTWGNEALEHVEVVTA